MKQVLIVVDMQNDFITGSLGTPEARAIIGNVAKKIRSKNWDRIIVTKDTHFSDKNYDYFTTLEGEKLPVEHCIIGTNGWNLENHVIHALNDAIVRNKISVMEIFKPTFGSEELIRYLKNEVADKVVYRELEKCEVIDDVCDLDLEVEIVGLCTDICVISNALLLRAAFPNMKITCDSSCCAGVTPEKHEAALEVMCSCQIDVI